MDLTRCYISPNPRAISSAGRAPPRQGGGHWFEPSIAHSRKPRYHGAFVVLRHRTGIAAYEREYPVRTNASISRVKALVSRDVTPPDAAYVPRLLDLQLDALAAQLPAVMVTGARAAGKTTTLARRAATVVRLDVPAQAAAFEADPDSALRGLAEPVLLDEWQAVPPVLGAVRRAVESDASG